MFGKESTETAKHSKLAILWNCVTVIVSASVLGIFTAFLGATTVTDGMFVGFLAWLGFVAPAQISSVIWGKMNFNHFVIHCGCQLLSFLAMGGVLGA